MYINRSTQGHGYFTTVKSKTKEGDEVKTFVNIYFKKGTEPVGDTYVGDLYFIDEQGTKRKAFMNCYEKNGTVSVGLVLLEEEFPKDNPVMQRPVRKEEPKPTTLNIEAEELPFY